MVYWPTGLLAADFLVYSVTDSLNFVGVLLTKFSLG